jgi:hypothetical protein
VQVFVFVFVSPHTPTPKEESALVHDQVAFTRPVDTAAAFDMRQVRDTQLGAPRGVFPGGFFLFNQGPPV